MSDIVFNAPRVAEHPLAQVLRHFLRDLAVALTLFLPVPQRRRLSGDPRVLVPMLAAALFVAALAGYVGAARHSPVGLAHFAPPGAYVLLTRLFVAGAVVFLVAVASGRLHRLTALLAGLLAVEIVAAPLALIASVAEMPVLRHAFGLWCVAVVLRNLLRELDIALPRRLLAALAVGVVLWAVAAGLPPWAMFHPSSLGGHRHAPLNVERVYLDQERLVRQALDAVQPSRPDTPDTYFVGFASFAAQNVFENEVKHIETLFREKLDAEGRTALLVNSYDTVDELPLANGHNLRAVLEGMRHRMGPEDLLFLHMTSHGSSNHEFSVQFGRLGLNDLTAREIGDIVGGAALPWSVIVVSACFSGGYIERLKSPRALVITASRADRQSFGCEHGREYTYFGEALYRDSLDSVDYQGAFLRAAAIVREREAAEGLEPSEPQLWIGDEIAARLGPGLADAALADAGATPDAEPPP